MPVFPYWYLFYYLVHVICGLLKISINKFKSMWPMGSAIVFPTNMIVLSGT